MCTTSVTLAILLTALGQAPNEESSDQQRRERLEFLKEQAALVELHRGAGRKTALKVSAEPVLRYSNTERWEVGTSDGAMFLWLDEAVPVAAMSISIRRPRNQAYRELTSLCEDPLECTAAGGAVWTPKTGGLLARPLDGAPADGRFQRLAQMRTLAGRFSVTCYDAQTDEPRQLRLLTSPVYRFAAEERGIVDGALFAFVVSNDPEMLVLLEAIREGDRGGGKLQWRYSLARMSSLPLNVRLDDKEVWSLTNFHRDPREDRKTGPYTTGTIGFYVPSVSIAPAPPQP